MARYRDVKTGKFVSLDKARELRKTIYKTDNRGKERISKNFKVPPKFSGVRIRDLKTKRYVKKEKAVGRWVTLEEWESGQRKETSEPDLYSLEEINKIEDFIKKNKGATGQGANWKLLNEYDKAKMEWGTWETESEKALIISNSVDAIVNLFRAKLNKKQSEQWKENEDLADKLIMEHIAEQETSDFESMSFAELEDFLNDYLEQIKDNLDDLDLFAVPF